jgi:excisionase family DNA binding protein
MVRIAIMYHQRREKQMETSPARNSSASDRDRNGIIYQSVAELAQELGVSRHAAYSGLRNGTIPHRRLGKRFIISKTAIANWLSGSGPK